MWWKIKSCTRQQPKNDCDGRLTAKFLITGIQGTLVAIFFFLKEARQIHLNFHFPFINFTLHLPLCILHQTMPYSLAVFEQFLCAHKELYPWSKNVFIKLQFYVCVFRILVRSVVCDESKYYTIVNIVCFQDYCLVLYYLNLL